MLVFSYKFLWATSNCNVFFCEKQANIMIHLMILKLTNIVIIFYELWTPNFDQYGK